ncbi:helix-turn-helix transcriptional regulator [Ruania alba]|uniref:DNA-binding transcriptional regulator, PadR family n=1 Tax=Ruania alba TaxID=648782 RepID=A0A1H5GHE2_9MICO|nr:helix-turn-helix transcriptional regulator [Ruania alba]SEE15186.1 DNA-binding transcriptional regulator, PadR family [Ruania alba]
MAHVILGLLLIGPQSLYGLVKAFEAGPSLFYSASSGSIKRALDGLLADGLIEVVSTEEGARGKKVYGVTDAGGAAFRRWMTSEIVGPDLETAVLPRQFFLGLVAPAERVAVLRLIVDRIDSDVAGLEALEQRLETVEVPDGYQDIAEYQRATLSFGIASGQFTANWFREQLDEVTAAPDPVHGPDGGPAARSKETAGPPEADRP